MKIRPTSKHGGVLVELGPQEAQVPAQAALAPPLFNLKQILEADSPAAPWSDRLSQDAVKSQLALVDAILSKSAPTR